MKLSDLGKVQPLASALSDWKRARVLLNVGHGAVLTIGSAQDTQVSIKPRRDDLLALVDARIAGLLVELLDLGVKE